MSLNKRIACSSWPSREIQIVSEGVLETIVFYVLYALLLQFFYKNGLIIPSLTIQQTDN